MTTACCCSAPCGHAYDDATKAMAAGLFGRQQAAPDARTTPAGYVAREGSNPHVQVDHSEMAEYVRELFGR